MIFLNAASAGFETEYISVRGHFPAVLSLTSVTIAWLLEPEHGAAFM